MLTFSIYYLDGEVTVTSSDLRVTVRSYGAEEIPSKTPLPYTSDVMCQALDDDTSVYYRLSLVHLEMTRMHVHMYPESSQSEQHKMALFLASCFYPDTLKQPALDAFSTIQTIAVTAETFESDVVARAHAMAQLSFDKELMNLYNTSCKM